MTSLLRFVKKLPLVPLFIGMSLVVGLIVPSIYEQGRELHNRSRFVGLEKLTLATIFVTVIACVVGVLIRQRDHVPTIATPSKGKMQFKLRDVFIWITLSAVLLAAIPLFTPHWSSVLVLGIVIAIFCWGFTCEWRIQSRLLAILASMFLPFVWVIAFNRPFGTTSGLVSVLPLGPGIVPAQILRGFMRLDMERAAQLGVLFVIAQLVIAVILVRRGGKLPIAYATILLLNSSFSSLGLHALYRA